MKLSNCPTVKPSNYSLCIVHFGSAAFAAEPIRWFNGDWDETGAAS